VWLATVGDRAGEAISQISQRRGLSDQDRVVLADARATYLNITEVLRNSSISDQEARRRIAALQSNMNARLRSLNQQLAQVEQRLVRLEDEQQRQWRVLFDTRGQLQTLTNEVVQLDQKIVDIEARLDSTQGRVSDIDQRTQVIEGIVAPDPARYLRHGVYLSLAATYADATALQGDAAFGGSMTAQANLSRHIGVYGDFSILPISASDLAGPEGSSLEWITVPAVLGLTLNLLPPQSPLSLQFSGGGGLAYSALRYYPPDYDPELANWENMKSVSNVIGSAKVEIGAAPPLAEIEPVLTVGLLRFVQPLEYASSSAGSNAGRELWYVSLGIRSRSKLPGERVRTSR
jgi:hypothetical protein